MIARTIILAAQSRLRAADVDAAFAPIVSAINGLLSGSAFSPRARLRLANRTMQRALVALRPFPHGLDLRTGDTIAEFVIPAVGPAGGATPIAGLSFTSMELLLPVYATGWTITGTITCYLNGVAVGSVSPAAQSGVFTIPIPGAPVLQPLDVITARFNIAGYDGLQPRGVLTFWMKAPHVR